MSNKILLMGITLFLVLPGLSAAETAPEWTKQFVGYVRLVDFSNDGQMMIVGVNHMNSDIPESLMFSIYCLKTSDGEVIWDKELQGYAYNWEHYISQAENYIIIEAGIPHESGEGAKEIFLYVISKNGKLLWRGQGQNDYYWNRFSPNDINLAEYVSGGETFPWTDQSFMRSWEEAREKIVIRRIDSGNIVSTIYIQGGILGIEFLSDSTIVVIPDTTQCVIIDLLGKRQFQINIDTICTEYRPDVGFLKIADTTRIVLQCLPNMYVLNDKLEILRMDSFIPRRYFSARPVEAIGVHLKGGIYFFTKDGEYLGEKGLAGFSDKVGDITQIRDTLGNVIDTWDDIFFRLILSM